MTRRRGEGETRRGKTDKATRRGGDKERKNTEVCPSVLSPCPLVPLSVFVSCFCCYLLLLYGSDAAGALPGTLSGEPSPGLGGNTIGDIVWSGRDLWVGTDLGISRQVGSAWVTYGADQGLGRGSIGAIAVEGETVVVSTIFDTTISGQGNFQVGDGLSMSFDKGMTWKHLPNEAIFGQLPGGPGTGINNGAFGLALDRGTIWGAFFAGSLVRSRDGGVTWERVLPDGSERIDYKSLEQRAFSVLAYHDTVWVGTAAGIARTTDGGGTWEWFRAEADADSHKTGTISGNWVVTLFRQRFEDQTIIWAGTKSTGMVTGESEGISFSQDDGKTWNVASLGMSAWNFAFQDRTVWAATDQGLFRSDDLGESWRRIEVHDPDIRETLKGTFVGVEVAGETIWVGAENGLGWSGDRGATWRIAQAPLKTLSLDRREVVGAGGEIDSVKTYAYPTPFSPEGNEEANKWVRIRYSLSQTARVTVNVYDFAGRPVRMLIEDALRGGGADHSENWDGRNGEGKTVANGVYFYRITTDRGDTAFGKIVVLN